jgi:hypothetical protein
VQATLHRPHPDAEQLRDLSLGEAGHVVGKDSLSLAIRQLGHSLANAVVQLQELQAVLERHGGIGGLLGPAT